MSSCGGIVLNKQIATDPRLTADDWEEDDGSDPYGNFAGFLPNDSVKDEIKISQKTDDEEDYEDDQSTGFLNDSGSFDNNDDDDDDNGDDNDDDNDAEDDDLDDEVDYISLQQPGFLPATSESNYSGSPDTGKAVTTNPNALPNDNTSDWEEDDEAF